MCVCVCVFGLAFHFSTLHATIPLARASLRDFSVSIQSSCPVVVTGLCLCVAGLAAYELLSDPVRASQLDVVFMDILMPGLSGIEVLERLGVNRPSCPIIATTGSVEESTVLELRYDVSTIC
jgi:CheY-like chemotaxis protein